METAIIVRGRHHSHASRLEKQLSAIKLEQFLSSYIPENRFGLRQGWRSLQSVMHRPYSDDLRCKLLEAYEAGRGSLRELAEQFGVSWGYSKKIRAQQLQKERAPQTRHGPPSRLTAAVEQQLRSALGKQPDLTLAELRQRLAERAGVDISRSRLWVWLQRLDLRHKKIAPGARAGLWGEPLAPPGLVGASKPTGSRLSGLSR